MIEWYWVPIGILLFINQIFASVAYLGLFIKVRQTYRQRKAIKEAVMNVYNGPGGDPRGK